MIDRIYTRYFQKSKSFLYPVLGIKRSSPFNPVDTYLCLPGKVEPDEMILVVLFHKSEERDFRVFEQRMLLANPLFLARLETVDQLIYLFNYEMHQRDWYSFLMGKYSRLSEPFKRAIKAYYGEDTGAYQYIHTYLYPEKFFELYATLLDVDVNVLRKIGELCDAWDEERETLSIPVDNLSCEPS